MSGGAEDLLGFTVAGAPREHQEPEDHGTQHRHDPDVESQPLVHQPADERGSAVARRPRLSHGTFIARWGWQAPTGNRGPTGHPLRRLHLRPAHPEVEFAGDAVAIRARGRPRHRVRSRSQRFTQRQDQHIAPVVAQILELPGRHHFTVPSRRPHIDAAQRQLHVGRVGERDRGWRRSQHAVRLRVRHLEFGMEPPPRGAGRDGEEHGWDPAPAGPHQPPVAHCYPSGNPCAIAHSIASQKRSSSSSVVYTLGEIRSPVHSSWPIGLVMIRWVFHSQVLSATGSSPSAWTLPIPHAKPGFRLVLRVTRSSSSRPGSPSSPAGTPGARPFARRRSPGGRSALRRRQVVGGGVGADLLVLADVLVHGVGGRHQRPDLRDLLAAHVEQPRAVGGEEPLVELVE